MTTDMYPCAAAQPARTLSPMKRVVVALSALVLLSGCGSTDLSNQTAPTSSPEPIVSSPAAEATPFTITEIAPDEEAERVEPVTRSSAKPTTVPGRSTPTKSPDREPERVSSKPDSTFPSGFAVPEGAKIFEQASKLSGDSSFIVLTFETEWRRTAAQLQEDLESDGWVCTSCLPFEGREPTKGTANWRYLLNMERDGNQLIGVISETGSSSQADLNFGAGR
jgi:hypothetical protein